MHTNKSLTEIMYTCYYAGVRLKARLKDFPKKLQFILSAQSMISLANRNPYQRFQSFLKLKLLINCQFYTKAIDSLF